jgi:phage baseplate assembly protein W
LEVELDQKAFLGRGWAYPVAPDTAGVDVALAEHEEDIRQAVRIILETGRGERVMRPDFGAGLNEFLFEPINTTTLAVLRHRVEESLVTWEPRIRVEIVEAKLAAGAQPRTEYLDPEPGLPAVDVEFPHILEDLRGVVRLRFGARPKG